MLTPDCSVVQGISQGRRQHTIPAFRGDGSFEGDPAITREEVRSLPRLRRDWLSFQMEEEAMTLGKQ